jgi:hypothetical protein
MEIGEREEIFIKGVVAIMIIQRIMPEVITTSLINPSLKRTIVYRQQLIFIHS